MIIVQPSTGILHIALGCLIIVQGMNTMIQWASTGIFHIALGCLILVQGMNTMIQWALGVYYDCVQ